MGGLGSGRKPAGSTGLVKAEGVASTDKAWPLRDRLAKRFREAELAGSESLSQQTAGWPGRSPGWKRAAIAALTAQGFTSAGVAELLGTSAAVVRNTLSYLRKRGRVPGVASRYDDVIVPMAMEAHEAEIADRSSPGHQKAYLAALTGRGVLRTAEVKAAPSVAMNQLQVVFQMPEGPMPVLTGTVVGAPRED